jgi:hypothetical protein
MNSDDFINQHPTLSGYLAGDFPYATASDEETARRIAVSLVEVGGKQDITLHAIIGEGEDVLSKLDEQWQLLARVSSRKFNDVAEARRWLQSILNIWKQHAND